MTIDAIGAPRPSLQLMLEAFKRYEETGTAGEFSDALAMFMGQYDAATSETMAAIVGLKAHQGPTPVSMRHGRLGEHGEDRVADIQATTAAYLAACNGLFRDYGIDTSPAFVVGMDGERQVRVQGTHPDKERIEALLNGSYLMRNTVSMLLGKIARQQAVDAGLAEQGLAAKDFCLGFADEDGQLSAALLFAGATAPDPKVRQRLAEADAAEAQLAAERAADVVDQRQVRQMEEWLKSPKADTVAYI
jgi:hypothetical protein